MSYLQAIVIGLLQGFAELFPISSLGHVVVVPALIGGSWAHLVTEVASPESSYLAFVVGLHVATALALIVVFRHDWARLVQALFSSVRHRAIATPEEKLVWLIALATVPVGILGLVLEHALRTLFAKPLAASLFLMVNGVLLLAGERFRRGAVPLTRPAPVPVSAGVANVSIEARGSAAPRDQVVAADLGWRGALVIGLAQCAALLAGISRDGICMVVGLVRGLSHEEAARFAFLLSAPPILAAGLLKLPDLLGPLGNGVRPQILAGSVAAFVTAYGAARLLLRWFRLGTLVPFAVYCLGLGLICSVRFA